MKKWITDIRAKTKDMNREQALEYIVGYYWYHILIACILLGLILLLIYHIGWGDRKKEFSCVLVNQEIDFARDEELAKEFGSFCGLGAEQIRINSDYQISYGEKQLEGVNESSYEKFFFNWSAGEIDAMNMPESFYEYCIKQNGEFSEEKIYIKDTWLKDMLIGEEEDPVVLVFAEQSRHKDNCAAFMEFVCDKGR